MTNEDTNPNPADLPARFARLNLLYQVSNVIHSTLDQQQALELILSEAVRLMRASSGSVALLNPTTGFLEIAASHGLPANVANLRLRLGEGITGWVTRTGKPARVDQVREDPRYIMIRENIQSELAVPLDVTGDLRGVINVDSERPKAFSVEDEELLQELALQAAKVIRNTWLYEQLRLKARLFETLFHVGQVINSVLNVDEALNVITREAASLMGAKMGSLLLRDETGEWLDLRASYGAGPAYLQKPRLSVSESLLGIVVRRRRPIQVENVQVSSRYQSVQIAREEGLVSLLSVPLVFRGEALGTLSVYTGELHSFSNEEIRILSSLAELSAMALERARLYERVVDIEEQLRQSEKLSAIGLLAAEVAHEIRNPLTVMKMLYHSLDLQFETGDPRAKDAAIMAEKMEHLNRVVEQVLDLARRTEPMLKRVNVNQLIDDLRLLTRHKLSQQKVELILELDRELPSIMADPTQLEQAFLNLTLNAAEAMPDGGVLTISSKQVRLVRQSPAPSHVLVEFRDTGGGMSSDQQKRAFVSLLSTTKRKGTGLGLAMVARVMEAHHGKVKVSSRLGRGTSMKLYLPLAPARQDPVAPAPPNAKR